MELLECRLTIEDLDSFVAQLGDIGERHGVTVQAFDARYVADRRHLERAVALADRAIDRGENVARDRAVEILLYGAGRRQIDRALEMGVDEGEHRAVVLIDADPTLESGSESNESGALEAVTDLEVVADAEAVTGPETVADVDSDLRRESALEATDEETLCAFFEISDAERAATDASLEALVHERVALLAVEK